MNEVVAKLDPAHEGSDAEAAPEFQDNSEFQSHDEAPADTCESEPPMEFENGHADTQFEVAPEGEPQNDELSTGFAFEFTSAPQDDQDAELEGEPNPPQFESSGLPAPPIA